VSRTRRRRRPWRRRCNEPGSGPRGRHQGAHPAGAYRSRPAPPDPPGCAIPPSQERRTRRPRERRWDPPPAAHAAPCVAPTSSAPFRDCTPEQRREPPRAWRAEASSASWHDDVPQPQSLTGPARSAGQPPPSKTLSCPVPLEFHNIEQDCDAVLAWLHARREHLTGDTSFRKTHSPRMTRINETKRHRPHRTSHK
jgi:hypothetical protein